MSALQKVGRIQIVISLVTCVHVHTHTNLLVKMSEEQSHSLQVHRHQQAYSVQRSKVIWQCGARPLLPKWLLPTWHSAAI